MYTIDILNVLSVVKNESKSKEKTVVIKDFIERIIKTNAKTERKIVYSRNSCLYEKVREKSVVVKCVKCDVCVCSPPPPQKIFYSDGVTSPP